MSDFHDLIATENLFNKKNCFSQELSKTLRNNRLKIADGQKAQNRKAVKNFKKRKHYWKPLQSVEKNWKSQIVQKTASFPIK